MLRGPHSGGARPSARCAHGLRTNERRCDGSAPGLPPQVPRTPTVVVSRHCPVNSRCSPKRCGPPAAHLRRRFTVVPAAEPLDHGICSRYQRAAARWPTEPPPSYERFASALARLHDAAGAARLAARRCDEAKRTVRPLLRTPPLVHAVSRARCHAGRDLCTSATRAVGRRLVRIRACLRRSRLDAALARGADPWSSGELMARAARLGSLSERRKLLRRGCRARGARRTSAARRRRTSRFGIRWCSSSETSLLALAERLASAGARRGRRRRAARRLLTDPSSPVFAGGNHPDGLPSDEPMPGERF